MSNGQEVATKPGWKTTEFWLGAVVPMVATVLNAIFGWNIDPDYIMGMFIGGGAYAGSRAYVKANDVTPDK